MVCRLTGAILFEVSKLHEKQREKDETLEVAQEGLRIKEL